MKLNENEVKETWKRGAEELFNELSKINKFRVKKVTSRTNCIIFTNDSWEMNRYFEKAGFLINILYIRLDVVDCEERREVTISISPTTRAKEYIDKFTKLKEKADRRLRIYKFIKNALKCIWVIIKIASVIISILAAILFIKSAI